MCTRRSNIFAESHGQTYYIFCGIIISSGVVVFMVVDYKRGRRTFSGVLHTHTVTVHVI